MKSFPYQAEPERERVILTNYSRLKLGMSKRDVESAIGSPDFGKLTMPGIIANYDGSEWNYYFYKLNAFDTNELTDQFIDIFFDRSGKVKWIAPRNIEGLVEVGRPY